MTNQQNKSFSFRDYLSQKRTPTMSQVNSRLKEVFTILKETLEANSAVSSSDPLSFHLIPVDHSEDSQLLISAVLFVVYDKLTETAHFSTLWVKDEQTWPTDKDRELIWSQQNVQSLEAIFEKKMAGVKNASAKNFRNSGSGLILPTDFHVDAWWAEKLSVMFDRAMPIEIDPTTGSSFINLGLAQRDGSTFYIQHEFHKSEKVDLLGFPVRNDVTLTFGVSLHQNTYQDEVRKNNDMALVEVTGYIELTLSSSGNPPLTWAPAVPKYIPRFIMTGVETQNHMQGPQAMILAMACVDGFMHSAAWVGMYESDLGANNSRDLNPFFALHSLPIFAKTHAINPKEFIQMNLAKVMELGYLLSFEIPMNEVSGDGYVADMHVLYSEGFGNALKAALAGSVQRDDKPDDRLLGELVRAQMFFEATVVDLGYFINVDGEPADVRNIDFLALLNKPGVTEETANRFADSYFMTQTGAMHSSDGVGKGQKERRRIRQAVYDAIHYTTKAVRVDVMPPFIQLVNQTLLNSGMRIEMKSENTQRPSINMSMFSR